MKLKSLLLAILLILSCLLVVSCDEKDKPHASSEDISPEVTDSITDPTEAPTTSQKEPSTTKPEDPTSEPTTEVCPCTSTRTARENEIDSTCKTEGSYDEVVYCVACDKELSRTKKAIKKKATHTPSAAVEENRINSTCKTEGSYDEVVYCSVCDKELSHEKKTLAKAEHVYDQKVIADDYLKFPATETESAVYYYSCICGMKGQDMFACGDPLGHTHQFDKTVVSDAYFTQAATCTESAKYYHSCKCGEKGETTFTNGDPLGHTEVIDAAVAPTCTATGLTQGKRCSVCKEVLVTQTTVPAKGHSFSEWTVTKVPTESTKGEMRRDCANCNHFETTVVAELAHDHSRYEVTILDAVAPTCTATGLTEGKKCSGCGEILVSQQILPANGHDHKTVVTAPTCTTKGYTTYTCHCGDTYTGDETGALGHTVAPLNAVDPTCTKAGKTAGTYCSACKIVLVSQITIPATGHSYDDRYDASCNTCGAIREADCAHKTLETLPEVSASCTASGLTEGKKCATCGKILVAQSKIPANGHNHVSKVTAPTAAQNGSIKYACSVCGHSYTEELTPLSFTITAENKTQIGFTGTTNEALVIPAVFQSNGTWYRVVAIADSAFINCNKLISVIIPETVTSIGKSAFANCRRLTTVNIPYGVTTIEMATFACCDDLVNVTIPDSVSSIDRSVFGHCFKMTSITIPTSVTQLDLSAFEWCESLTAITFEGTKSQWNAIKKENAFESIGKCVIYCINGNICVEHTEVIDASAPPTCTTTGLTQGKHCSVCGTVLVAQNLISALGHTYNSEVTPPTATKDGYTTYTCHCGDNYTKTIVPVAFTITKDNRTMIGYTGQEENLVIPEVFEDNGTWYRVTSIGDFAFTSTNLTSVTISNSVTSIGVAAFHTCCSLTSVTIGNSVKIIGDGAFSDCSSLTNVTIPDSVASIGSRAFYYCFNLTSVTIGDSVTSIGANAFSDCYRLVEVINHSSLNIEAGSSNYGNVACYAKEVHTGQTKIVNQNGYLFYTYNNINYLIGHAENDTILTLPESYNGQNYAINNYAFRERMSLTSIAIPDSVTSIGYAAFQYCSSLKTVYYGGTATDWANFTISSNNSYLTSVTRYYYSETEPTTSGNYWHYVDGVPTAW